MLPVAFFVAGSFYMSLNERTQGTGFYEMRVGKEEEYYSNCK